MVKHYTADTITDEQIRELRTALLKESDNQFTSETDETGMALIDPTEPKYAKVRDVATVVRTLARARCAEILNARAKVNK
jgi:hypothetical protein